jgi:subtilisin-like proprotein convertase family protein
MTYIRATRSLAAAIVLAASAMTANATVYNGTGGALVDAGDDVGLAQFDINIAGTGGTVTSLNSITVSLTHTWIGDTVMELDAPDGTTYVSLASPPDSESANYNGTYTFVVDPTKQTIDEVSGPLTTSQDIPSGLYAPSDYGGGTLPGTRVDYNDFVGIGLDGTWTLFIADYGAGDTGDLTGWSIDVDYSTAVTPEPASLAAIAGLGGLGLVRRRSAR